MTNDRVNIQALIREVEEVKDFMIGREKFFSPAFFEQLHPDNEKSARNLIHYLALRSFDLRPVQEQLTTLGLSSLSHAERFTLVNIDNILHILYTLSGEMPVGTYPKPTLNINYPAGRKLLKKRTEAMFGPSPRGGSRIMVTLPTEASEDFDLVDQMLKYGMDVARINCSHDNEEKWAGMINNVRKAAADQQTSCLIYMDLPGPKIRTGQIMAGLNGKKDKGPGIRLKVGETLHIFREIIGGKEAEIGDDGDLIRPACISLTLPEIWKNVQAGQNIYFDDGKISGKIREVTGDKINVLITGARPEKGSLLRGDRGINLPDTDLTLPSLTEFDLKILPFICEHADMVGYSFVRKPADINQLQEHLRQFNSEDLPVILKIETQDAFKNLPELLLESMRSARFGVMLARGDLAIEVGFARIAEVQEQILWLCDAAHVPIIWATQVLENLLKDGVASRAEITDAAMSVRAECVMLNKGPFIKKALETLKNIDERMVNLMFKKHGALRPLNVAKKFFENRDAQKINDQK